MITGIGKQLRFRRLMDEDTGAILIVPMDHGYTSGPIKGLKHIANTVDQVFNGGASSVIVHKGLVRRLINVIPPKNGLVIHVSGSTNLSPNSNYKIMTGSVPEVLTYGADGISCHINLGADEDFSMLEDLASLVEDANDFGLPLLAMMYVRDSEGNESNFTDDIAHAARLAEELGADIVKVNSTQNIDEFEEVTQGVEIPVVIAGGAKASNFSAFLENVKQSIYAGASGVSVGRNIFQADNPMEAMKKVKDAIQEAVNEVGGLEILS